MILVKEEEELVEEVMVDIASVAEMKYSLCSGVRPERLMDLDASRDRFVLSALCLADPPWLLSNFAMKETESERC